MHVMYTPLPEAQILSLSLDDEPFLSYMVFSEKCTE